MKSSPARKGIINIFLSIPEIINLDERSIETKEDALYLFSCLVSVSDEETKYIYEGLLERERLSSTGLCYGFATPHCKLPDNYKLFNKCPLVAGFAYSKKGIDFDSWDHKPANFIFMWAHALSAPSYNLSFTATLCRLFKNSTFRESLMATLIDDPSIEGFYQIISIYVR